MGILPTVYGASKLAPGGAIERGLTAIYNSPQMRRDFGQIGQSRIASGLDAIYRNAGAKTAPAPQPQGFTPVALPNIPRGIVGPLKPPQTYGVGAIPLSAAQLAAFNRRQIGADADYASALAMQKRGLANALSARTTAYNQADRAANANRQGAISDLGGASLALSPMNVQAALQHVLNAQAAARAQATKGYSDTQALYANQVADALRAKKAEEQAIADEKRLYQTNPTGLLPGVSY